MSKSFFKHKILFDENMPNRSYFPLLNHHFDVKHIKQDLNKEGLSDPEVYELATKQNRIIITFNWPDFLKLVGRKHDLGIVGVGGNDWQRMDTKLTSLMMKHKPVYFKGKLKTLGNED